MARRIMDAVDEVKSRLSIEDVVGEYVPLKRAGRNFRGLSPFNSEKTPSFMVSPEKQIWHDFSSNKGGNMFSFIMEMEGVDFKEALSLLARKAGVDIEQYSRSGRTKGPDKQRLYEALDDAAKFYQAQLKGNQSALNYVFKTRGLTKPTVIEWRIGYSPNNGAALTNFLVKKGFTETELKQAGLSVRRQSGAIDMFRGRLMIPLQDAQGQVIGFTARLLDQTYGPKYINTQQTVLYDKSRHVFGLHLAKSAIRENNYAVISEGNMDVISSHQAGVRQVVATAGTAMTEAHLKTLSRFVSDIRLCFDGDRAGLNATERAIMIASRLRLSLNVIDLKDGKDPDEVIQKDPQLWRQAVENYVYAVDWLIEHYAARHKLDSADGVRQFTDEVLPVIRNIDDAVEVDHYINKISSRLGISRESLESKLKRQRGEQTSPVMRKAKNEIRLDPREVIEVAKAEDHLLCLMLMQPALREGLENINEDMLSREQAKALFNALKARPRARASEFNRVTSLSEYVKIEVLQFEELYEGLEQSELNYEVARLQSRLTNQYVKRQKLIIAQKLATADESQSGQLLEEARRLDELLRSNLGDANAENQESR